MANSAPKPNKVLDSPTKLTEFAPLNSVPPATNLRSTLAKFFGLSKGAKDATIEKSEPSSGETPQNNETPESSKVRSGSGSNSNAWQEEELDETADSYYGELAEGRSLPNVLKRISNLLAMRGTNLVAYKDADFKQYWMPDSVSKECYECGDKFTTFRRRHHCRICGQIFCSRCCNQEIPGRVMGYTGDLRVCTYCCKVVLTYLQSSDMASDLSTDLKTLQEDLQSKFSFTTPSESPDLERSQMANSPLSTLQRSSTKRKTSVGFQEERFATGRLFHKSAQLSSSERRLLIKDSAQLKALHEALIHPQHGIPLQTYRHKLRSFTGCVSGSDIVDWLIAHDKASSRSQGAAIGQALLEAHFLEIVSHPDLLFVDGYVLYRPRPWPLSPPSTLNLPSQSAQSFPESAQNVSNTPVRIETPLSGQEPLWVSQIRMPEEKDTLAPEMVQSRNSPNHSEAITQISFPTEHESSSRDNSSENREVNKDLILSGDFHGPPIAVAADAPDSNVKLDIATLHGLSPSSQLLLQLGSHIVADKVNELFEQHMSALFHQLLSAEGLATSWSQTLWPLIVKAAEIVKPDVRGEDDMDIRQYVQFKKLAGGVRANCCLVQGVVCSKQVAHRSMSTKILNPQILLLTSSIDYQRVANRLVSLDPLLMQENEYLKNAVAKIAAFKPDILLVEKTVSRLAQDFLLSLGLTLILNVKASVMDRIARSTQADIMPSIDTPLSKPKLGTCCLFHLENFTLDTGSSKTLMMFDGCVPHLGCTILLRGGSRAELSRVKKVASFVLYAAYHSKLEKSLLIDSFAVPPLPEVRTLFRDSTSPPSHTSTPLDSSPTSQESEPKLVSASSPIIQPPSPPKSQKIDDFSDPLHTYLQQHHNSESSLSTTPIDQSILSSPPLAQSLAVQYNRPPFKKLLEDLILTISPLICYNPPYLETETGQKCNLRRYLPPEIYYTPQFKAPSPPRKFPTTGIGFSAGKTAKLAMYDQAKGENSNLHPFLSLRITPYVSKHEIQTLLADFRARGGRLHSTTPKHGFVIEKSESETNPKDPETIEEDKLAGRDVLSPYNHQRLPVLFASFSPMSPNAPFFCVTPWVVNMDFYGRNDIALGGFLERYCFRPGYVCPSETCPTPMTSHIRRFVHDQACVHVLVRELSEPMPAPGNVILMWNWCRKCKQVSAVVPMSETTWHLSFAKYLELRFYGSAYSRRGAGQCSHSVQQDCHHYFGCRNLVASFKYSAIVLRHVCLPPALVTIHVEASLPTQVVEEIRSLALIGYGIYSSIADWLTALATELTGTRYEVTVSVMLEQQALERARLRDRIEQIQLMLTSPTLQQCIATEDRSLSTEESMEELLWNIMDHEVLLKRIIADAASSWNARLQDLIQQKRKDEKQNRPITNKNLSSYSSTTSLEASVAKVEERSESKKIEESLDSSYSERTLEEGNSSCLWMESSERLLASEEDKTKLLQPAQASPRHSRHASLTSCASFKVTEEGASRGSSPRRKISQESNRDASPKGHERSHSEGDAKVPEGEAKPVDKRASASTVKALLGSLLSSQAALPINPPFAPSEHHLLPPGTSIPLIVYETEPSSVIAYSLTSLDYERQLQDLRSEMASSASLVHSMSSGNEIKMGKSNGKPSVQPANDDRETWFETLEREEFGTHLPNLTGVGFHSHAHLELQFSDSNAKFYCRVYFAEQFRQLRSGIFPAGEERYARSLARCVAWNAVGGKSGSSFSKTADDRFVLKQMSRFETQSFLDFAPNYFKYVQKCLNENRPTAICKILGAYRIVYKNSHTNSASKQDLIVMENLFYNRAVTRKFDLKGSVRNRLVNPGEGDQNDCVLLDENLLKISLENPLYIRPHSKSVLSSAIAQDTQFLASQMVMDYSLLVGLDEKKSELVVGIIDYIRTFTWDKKLETFVKSSGILGGQGKMPTVVSPEVYRSRFCEAMSRYFTVVPDRWTGLGKGIDC